MTKTDIKGLTLGELSQSLEPFGLERYRAGQIFEWLQVKGVSSFSQMTNLPKNLRQGLQD